MQELFQDHYRHNSQLYPIYSFAFFIETSKNIKNIW